MDALEDDVPSTQDQFKWVQALAVRVGDLERDVARLKVSESQRKRSGIQAWLRNPLCPRPSMTLSTWLMSVSTIDLAQFDSDKDLVEIMQSTFLSTAKIPMCAFAGCKTVYAWDIGGSGNEEQEPVWLALTMKRWDEYFAKWQHRFRKAVTWTDDDECDDPEQREVWLQRIRKVNEVTDKRRWDLLVWLHKHLQTKTPVI